MDPQARAKFPPFLVECGEGNVTWMYLDAKGYVTTGIGQLLPTAQSAMTFDWRNPDGSQATASQIQGAWLVVKTHGELAGHGGGAFAGVTQIRATEASIYGQVAMTIDAWEPILRAEWPGWDGVPGPAQQALMRLAWALGPEFAAKWPRLHAAWCASDWTACAKECRIPELDKTEPKANALTAALFLSCVTGANS